MLMFIVKCKHSWILILEHFIESNLILIDVVQMVTSIGLPFLDLSGMQKDNPSSSFGTEERWTFVWKVEGSIPRLDGPCATIAIFSASCAVTVFRKRHKP